MTLPSETRDVNWLARTTHDRLMKETDLVAARFFLLYPYADPLKLQIVHGMQPDGSTHTIRLIYDAPLPARAAIGETE